MPRSVRTVLLGCATAGAALVLWRWNPWQGLTLDGMRAVVDAWGPLGPLVFMAIMVGGFFLPGPELLLVAAGGVLFGPLWGFVYAWLAAVVGTAGVFLLVRYTAQDWAQRALRHRFARLRALDQRLHHNGFALVAVLRLLLFLTPPLSWALGASRVRLTDYVLGTALGIAPMMGLAVVFAHRVAGAGSTADMLELDVVLPGAALVLLIAVGLVLGRRMLTGPSSERAEPAGRQAHGRPADQRGAVEGGQHGRRGAAHGEAEEPGQPVHELPR